MSQQRSQETREKIMQAALACFARAGYDGSGVAEICAAAEVSKGAFYHHFPSKQAVFLALLNAWLAALDARFAVVRAQSGSAPESLRAMAAAARQVFSDARGQLPMFLEFWTQAARDPLVLELTVEPYRRYEQYFASLIESGIEEGSLRPVDPLAAARAILALALGMLIQAQAHPAAVDWADMVESGVDLLLQGIKRK